MSKKNRFIFALLLLIICILIVVLFDSYPVIRGFLGDVIVVALIYNIIKIFFDIVPLKLCICILIFTYFVELLQCFDFVKLIGLSENELARTMIGTTFDVKDLAAYTLGAIFTYLIEIKYNS